MAPRFPPRDVADAWATTTSRWLGVAFLLVGLVNYVLTQRIDGTVLMTGCTLVGASQASSFFRELARPPRRSEDP